MRRLVEHQLRGRTFAIEHRPDVNIAFAPSQQWPAPAYIVVTNGCGQRLAAEDERAALHSIAAQINEREPGTATADAEAGHVRVAPLVRGTR